MTELLLLSNSRAPGLAFLEHAAGAIRSVLGERARILFVPFASGDPGAYAELMRNRRRAGLLRPVMRRRTGVTRYPGR